MGKIVKRVLTRNGIQYFDAGGTVISGNQPGTFGAITPGNVGNTVQSGGAFSPNNAVNPFTGIQSSMDQVGGITKGIGSAFTQQNPYQATLAPTMTSDYSPAIAGGGISALEGYGQFSGNLANQQELQQALMREANGTLANQAAGVGPNPAQTALAQNTGANVANTAALIAGARGASANPGLAARSAAQQGAQVGQNAVGQAATLQAQQQIQAEQQKLAALAGAGQIGQGIGTQIVGEQNANTGLLGTAAGAQNAQNTGSINNTVGMEGINAQVAQHNADAVNKSTQGLLGGGASLLSSIFAKGGTVLPAHYKHMAKIYHPHKMAEGGDVIQVPTITADTTTQSGFGGGSGKGGGSGGSGGGGGGLGSLVGLLALLQAGGEVPGKAKVKGNSYSNDTVPALLSPEEIVLPRSVTTAPDAPEKAREFVANELRKKYDSNPEDEEDFKTALKKAISNRRGANA